MIKLTHKAQTKAIKNASKAFRNSESLWAREFWFTVWKNLCLKYKRTIHSIDTRYIN